jgi:transcriptional regulator with XRE-family HTH domain
MKWNGFPAHSSYFFILTDITPADMDDPMKLADYLSAKNIKRTDFAGMVGVSQSYITQICQGQIWPGRDIALRIMEATDGQVGPNDFLTAIDPSPRPVPASTSGEAA